MKKSLPVMLGDLQATAKDDRNGQSTYAKLTVRYIDARNCFTYEHDGYPCNEAFVISTLNEYAKRK